MMRKALIGLAIVAALLVPAAARAHEGHVHKVTGTVTLRQADKVTIRTTDGKTVTVTLNAKTIFENAAKKVDQAALQVGHRVVVDVGNGKEPLVARGVKIGVKETK